MHKVKVLFLLIISGLFVFESLAQSPWFQSYTSIPGHRKIDVQVIDQDSDGYMWFGTKNGLFRYDGSKFIEYSKKNGLFSNRISAFTVDSLGTIWVGHPSGQISFSTNGTDFQAFEPEEGLPVVEISSFFIDNNQTLWFSTMGEGVYSYKGMHRKRLYNLSVDEGMADNYVYNMVQDAKGLYYFATDKGVSVYDSTSQSFVNTISMSDGLPDNIVTHLSINNSDLWIGMYEGGICKYNMDSESLEFLGSWPFSPIQDFVLVEDNRLMVSTQKHGIVQCIYSDGLLTFNRLDARNNLASNRTSTIVCDREGNLWIGTNKGISVRKNQGIEFLDASSGFNVTDVYGITLDKKGNYWIASQMGLYKSYTDYQGDIITEKVNISGNNNDLSFISIYCDSDGYIWVGTYGYGVFCVDPLENSVKSFSKKDGLTNENVIHINGDEKSIWLSTLGGGVLQLDKTNDNQIASYSTANGLTSDYVYSTFIDEEGKVWCATDGGGVSTIENDIANSFDSDYFSKHAKVVYSIAKCEYGYMWFNTQDLGVVKKQNDSYVRISDSTTFINGSILGLISSPYEMVSISDEIIEKYLYYQDEVIELGADEHIANHKPNLNAVYVDSMNNIWVGTAKGVIKLNHIEQSPEIKPLLAINRISLFFKPLEDINHKYSHNKNHLTFDFNALWFKDYTKLVYRYRLEGFDIDWTETSVMKRVTYSNLPHGDFKFVVQVNYPGGDWVETKQSVYEFVIIPPFWKQLWFIILLVLLLLALVVLFIKYRTHKLEEDKRLLEEEVQKRTAEIQNQKEEIEAQRDEISNQHQHVVLQRDRIESQNKNITSSIQYASRIQNALLPPIALIDAHINDYFIFFRPRDIVSGDFYFAMPYRGDFVIAAADCTGHGVPGAFMSVLSISLLKQILGQENYTYSAAEILDELRTMVKKSLGQTGKANEAKDGLDISLCILSNKNNTIQYAGAYNPLMVVRNDEIIQVKGDKMPIGIYFAEVSSFTNHLFETQVGDMIYLFSDGYQDQFGGTNNRKFLPKRLRNLLISIAKEPVDKQNQLLDEAFNKWRGKEPQVDDVLMIGIRCTEILSISKTEN